MEWAWEPHEIMVSHSIILIYKAKIYYPIVEFGGQNDNSSTDWFVTRLNRKLMSKNITMITGGTGVMELDMNVNTSHHPGSGGEK